MGLFNVNDDYIFNVKRKRPEETYNDALEYFTDDIVHNYSQSKSIMRTQKKITFRALEILELKKNHGLILDAGSGPGFVSLYLNELGFKTIAIDIVSKFLKFYNNRYLNPILSDMCYPPFRSNIFDAIVSVSALQWICKDLSCAKMLFNSINLFKSFYQILKPNSKAIFQFYPKSNDILENIKKIITENTSFDGNFIIDNPNNPKKRKIYLFLKKE